ncbi:NUDIX hydrolase [Sulfuritalea sp.]|uniref:NUDIX hydrolase n=1 Tax=Sulfuritalea sp. TaxID=2480090 RepID=UPI001AD45448|nr:NUDIX hydrolase [Sulfuritalea sp.]MBN8473776.1 NUDIX hydrolase [Sulfuritalea sp.]
MSTAFCQQCATPLATAMIGGKQRDRCPACGFVLWRNPAPVGMALIAHEGKLVLIRRSEAPLAGYWAPPAGYVECGESVPAAVCREALEECGLEIELDGLLGVYSQADVEVLILAYRARSVGGCLCAGDDASEVRLFAADRLPMQAPPDGGTLTDQWFFGVIEDTITRWRPAPAPV